VNGADLTLQNAQQVIGGMFGWQEGQEITLDLERNGEAIVINTVLSKAYATTQSLVEDEAATEEQIALRNAWLKG
ncbi:MAG: peptidase M61, partial [Winogradskyella sp.]|nr:peptidase M61 [Winogradskyella sp.]